MTPGDILKAKRCAKMLTQEEFAAQVGCNVEEIEAIEKGIIGTEGRAFELLSFLREPFTQSWLYLYTDSATIPANSLIGGESCLNG